MRAMRISIAFGIAVLMSGCVVPSLHPLINGKDLVFEPALLGTWVLENGKDTLTFRRQAEGTYMYTMIYDQKKDGLFDEPGEPAEFEAGLVRVGEFLFLDIYPGEPMIKNGLYLMHLIPVHTFPRIRTEGDVLHLAWLDPGWLKNMITQGKVEISYERFGENEFLLTAPTHELQSFFLKYAEDAQAFPKQSEWHRQQ